MGGTAGAGRAAAHRQRGGHSADRQCGAVQRGREERAQCDGGGGEAGDGAEAGGGGGGDAAATGAGEAQLVDDRRVWMADLWVSRALLFGVVLGENL